ncbi:Trk system potassium transporter TrkA [Pseudoalteromonas sp. NZS127_1]|jgi:trk system potassium uptake protein TrkA|uniref:Trk system potassium uptake protein TrkA n=6 Tax=Pseudoalteromonas TaxID=53246 RepID=A0AAP7CNK6_9GAMM|nr:MULTISPECIES: Trk system potassium transporter TrkA [Pseudoalteromonas]ATC84811.1 trk system potassium uptake protein TrkA [Pseudoalteromonas arctica A 37-1-2]EGI73305.1 Trk system potassium uptake protein TrkA [Pseudoalteromonas distincta]KAA1164286.1 Trk system potassium transporter TrkA [Pseudoalteromonas distincta]KHM50453.1 potassium transporter peripheral membrane component [Pseudoalteromonas elyakovii]KID40184.1 potassium transporter peripheral membrane component [Pseudoalteromonas d|tara:strand:- start:46058 stop:47434 length:1377 start_codon:yes stop_codon:yes gene_type:complete
MKIIILGAGQVGATLAENLVGEQNEITVVDIDGNRLRELQDKYDLQGVMGHSAHPDVLRRAGAEDADMIIAVTSSDEVNMVACQVAYSIFKTPTKIARIRSEQYLKYREKLFQNDDLPIDHYIAPEALVTKYIRRLIDYPGALQVLQFADGMLSLVAVKAYYGGLLVGYALSALKEHIPNVETRVAAIYRQGKAIKPLGTTVIEADDEVFFIAATKHIRAVMNELQKLERSYKKIMIAGGGNIGAGLARSLEKNHTVKLIERSKERAEQLSEMLDNTVVFCGDASDQELLSEEHIEQVDVFIAVTNDDEANIMSAMLAKRMGAQKTMVLIQRGAYVDLVQGGEIDIAISPQQATISALLTHVRRGDIVNVYSLRKGAAEAIEAVAHGDENTSKVVGRAIADIKLPAGTTIGAIVRNDDVLIAHDDTIIMSGDHVIMFLIDKKHITVVEKLFQVSAIFL